MYPMSEQYGVKMVLPRVSPQPHTHLAFEGFQYAKEQGKGNAYNHRMFKAFFQEELDIGQVDVLVKLAGEIGLNEAEYARRWSPANTGVRTSKRWRMLEIMRRLRRCRRSSSAKRCCAAYGRGKRWSERSRRSWPNNRSGRIPAKAWFADRTGATKTSFSLALACTEGPCKK